MHLDTDQLAALVRAYGTPAEQRAFRLNLRVYNGDLCPECGAGETEDNNCEGSDLEFRCVVCDHRWAPADVEFTQPAAAPEITDADLDLDAMFPTPAAVRAPTSRRDVRITHTTNRRGW